MPNCSPQKNQKDKNPQTTHCYTHTHIHTRFCIQFQGPWIFEEQPQTLRSLAVKTPGSYCTFYKGVDVVYTITSVVSVSGFPWRELLYSDYASEFYSRCRAIAFQHRGKKREGKQHLLILSTCSLPNTAQGTLLPYAYLIFTISLRDN